VGKITVTPFFIRGEGVKYLYKRRGFARRAYEKVNLHDPDNHIGNDDYRKWLC
jgi:hypothetical protein